MLLQGLFRQLSSLSDHAYMRRRHDLPITRFDCSTFVLHDLEYVKVSLVRSYHKNEPLAALITEANQHGEDKSVLNTFEAHVCDQSLGER